MARRLLFLLAGLLVFSALAAPLSIDAADIDRRLEKAAARAGFTAAETGIVARAYEAALEGGLGRRDTLALVKLCIEGGFSGAQTARALTLAAQLSLTGLPSEGFESKIREGVAKRVPPESVLAAAERRALASNRAEKVLNSLILKGYNIDDREEFRYFIADAIESGKGEREIREIVVPALDDGESMRKIRRKLLR